MGTGQANPLQTLSQGLVLTLHITFDPDLDNMSSVPHCLDRAIPVPTIILWAVRLLVVKHEKRVKFDRKIWENLKKEDSSY